VPYIPPTLDQFKAQFARDFPYSVPSYGATGKVTVAAGVVVGVTWESGGVFYKNTPVCVLSGGGGVGASITAMVTNNTVSAFAVGAGGTGYTSAPLLTVVSQDGDDTDSSKVMNADITKALGMAPANINPALFATEETFQSAFGLLAAHYLVTNILASTQGLKSQYDWLTIQRTVGNVNTSHAAPTWVKNSAFWSTLTSTRYGAQYLSLIAPLLHGNMRCVAGATSA
jgi:hypothetical protein